MDEPRTLKLPLPCIATCLLQDAEPPFSHSASWFSLSPAAKNIFTLHQEKMNSCLQDLYSLLCAI